MDFFAISSFIFVIITVLYYLCSKKYAVIINPFFWVTVLFVFYFQLPTLFVHEVNYYYFWNISSSSINYSQLLTSMIAIFFSVVMVLFNSDVRRFIDATDRHYPCVPMVKLLWWLIFFYLIAVVAARYAVGGLEMTSNYTGESSDPYKIKNVAYLLVPVSIIYYFNKKNILMFLPNVILILLDVLSGSRTSALIVLVPVMVSVCLLNKKLYIVPVSCMVVLLIVVGIIRSNNVVQNVPWYLNAIGEFRETYITLPLLIENSHYVGVGSLYTMLASLMLALLQPLRSVILESTTLPGDYIYQLVGRGYGLGANVLTEAMFYGYFLLLTIPAIFLGLGLGMLTIIRKFELPIVSIYCSMFIVFSRLIIREGAFYNVGLFMFVLLVYVMPILAVNYKLNVRIRMH